MSIAVAFWIIAPMVVLIFVANIAHHLSDKPVTPKSQGLDLIKIANETAHNELYSVGSYHPNNIWNGAGRRDHEC